MSKEVAVFGGGNWNPGDPEWLLAEEIGRLFATNGFVVFTGGYGGAMEAVSKGAVESGGKTFAYLNSSPDHRKPNSYVNDFEVADDYQARLASLLRIENAIALPGSSGTLAEIAGSLALLARKPGRHLALQEPYWKELIQPLLISLKLERYLDSRISWFTGIDDLKNWISKL